MRTKWKVLLRSKSSSGGFSSIGAVVERKDRSFRGNVMQKTLILLCPRLKSPQQSRTVKNDRSKTDPRLLPACARIARGTRRLRAAPCEHLCAAVRRRHCHRGCNGSMLCYSRLLSFLNKNTAEMSHPLTLLDKIPGFFLPVFFAFSFLISDWRHNSS